MMNCVEMTIIMLRSACVETSEFVLRLACVKMFLDKLC